MGQTLTKMTVDPSILRTHCVFSAYQTFFGSLGCLLERESSQSGSHKIQVNGDDLDAMRALDAVECVDGDAVMARIMEERSTKGKKMDIFLGVCCSENDSRVLAIECKLNVQAGQTLNNYQELLNDICEKYWTARREIKDSVPFVEKCYVIFANRVFEQASRTFRNAKLAQRNYNILNAMTPSMLKDSLDYEC